MAHGNDETGIRKALDESAIRKDAPGHVEFDSRGNSVWKWARDVLDSTTILLKGLDIDKLELEGGEGDKDPGGGFDPYNSRK